MELFSECLLAGVLLRLSPLTHAASRSFAGCVWLKEIEEKLNLYKACKRVSSSQGYYSHEERMIKKECETLLMQAFSSEC